MGDGYYSMEEDHLDCVLALESLPCKECPRGQVDATVSMSVLEESKSHGEPFSSSQEGPVLKQLHEHLRSAF